MGEAAVCLNKFMNKRRIFVTQPFEAFLSWVRYCSPYTRHNMSTRRVTTRESKLGFIITNVDIQQTGLGTTRLPGFFFWFPNFFLLPLLPTLHYGQDNQGCRSKYWAIRSSIRLFSSTAHSLSSLLENE